MCWTIHAHVQPFNLQMREAEEKRREAEVKMSVAEATAAHVAAPEVQQVCVHRLFSSHMPCEQEAVAYINFNRCHSMIDIHPGNVLCTG
jgi:hypothetical protein